MNRRNFLQLLGCSLAYLEFKLALPKLPASLPPKKTPIIERKYQLGLVRWSMDQDGKYIYLKASKDIIADSIVKVNSDFTAEPVTSSSQYFSGFYAVSVEDMKKNEKGWFFIEGRRLLALCLSKD